MESDQRRPSISATRIGLLIGVPIAVVIGIQTAAWAAITFKSWNSGDTLTAADLNGNFSALSSALTIERVKTTSAMNLGPQAMTATATCSAGKTVIGGGCTTGITSDGVPAADSCCIIPSASYPDTASSWTCTFFNNTNPSTNGPRFVTAHAICAGL
jgi:hypothetical protein